MRATLRAVLSSVVFVVVTSGAALAQVSVFRAGTPEKLPILRGDDRGSNGSPAANDPASGAEAQRRDDSARSVFESGSGWVSRLNNATENPSTIHRVKEPQRLENSLFQNARRPGGSGKSLQEGLGNVHKVRVKLDKFVDMANKVKYADKFLDAVAAIEACQRDNPQEAAAIAVDSALSDVASLVGAYGATGAVALTGVTGGTFLIGAGGALLAGEAYDLLGKPWVHERAAEYRLASIQTLLKKGWRHLREGKLQDADDTALEAVNSLAAILANDRPLAQSGTARELHAEGLAIRGRVAQVRLAVNRSEAFVNSVVADARNGKFYSVRTMVQQHLAARDLLEHAGREDLIRRLESLESEMVRIADEREMKKTAASSQPLKAAPSPPQPPKILVGKAKWQAPQGTASGMIDVTINVAEKSFHITFGGGAGGNSTVTYAGGFDGSFTGDGHSGELKGGGSIEAFSHASGARKSIGAEPFSVGATLSGGAVTGKAIGNRTVYPFNVPVQ